jgi:hypothetical protein
MKQIQYGIFNDLIPRELLLIPEVHKYQAGILGWVIFNQKEAEDKAGEINSYRDRIRRGEIDDPNFIPIDEIVGRPVRVKVMERYAYFDEWEDSQTY